MAITTTTITKAVSWARTDVIYALEEGISWLEWHQPAISGLVTALQAYSGGGTVGTADTDYYNIEGTASGVGTNATFDVYRDNGNINMIRVNKPGIGYTNGEVVTLPASETGAGTAGIVTVFVDGLGSPTSYGSTTTFFDKGVTKNSSYPWGVARIGIDTSKKYGVTYRGFQMTGATTLQHISGTSFYPFNSDNANDRGGNYGNSFRGNYKLDVSNTPSSSSDCYVDSSSTQYGTSPVTSQNMTIASSNSYALDLNIFKSSIDTKFAVFSFHQPTLSSTIINNNTFSTFFVHNFAPQGNLWDLEYLMTGGFTEIIPSNSSTDPYLEFRTYPCQMTSSGYEAAKRTGEFGYCNLNSSDSATLCFITQYFPNTSNDNEDTNDVQLYYRTNAAYSSSKPNRGRGGATTSGDEYPEKIPDSQNWNAVIKGIPLSTVMVPCPYYLPDDFALIQFEYDTPNANVQQWDTITISGSEVWTVITGQYNQTTYTKGILFCARTT